MITTEPILEEQAALESARHAAQDLQRDLPGADPTLLAVHRTFVRAHLLAKNHLDRRYAELGLSISRFNVLRLLHASPTGRLTMGEMSIQLSVSPPNVTKLVDALEKDGWLRRVVLPENRRYTYLELSEGGASGFLAVLPRIINTWGEMWMGLSRQEQADLTRLLEKFSTCFEAAGPCAEAQEV